MLVSSSLPMGVLESCLLLTVSLGKGLKDGLLRMFPRSCQDMEDKCAVTGMHFPWTGYGPSMSNP